MTSKISEYGKTAAVALGMASYWLLLRWAHNILVFSDVRAFGIGSELTIHVMTVLVALFALAALFGSKGISRFLTAHRYTVLTCGGVTSLFCATALLELPAAPLFAALVVLRIVFLALSFVLLTLSWGLILSRFGTNRIYAVLAFSLFLSFFLYNLEDVSGFIGMILPVTAPLISALCQLPCQSGDTGKRTNLRMPVRIDSRLFVVILSFVLATGLIRWVLYREVLSFIPQGTSILFINGISMASSLVILFVFYRNENFRWASYLTWIIYTLICFSGLLLMAFQNPGQTDIGGSIVLMSRANFGFLLFILFVAHTLHGESDKVVQCFAGYALIDAAANVLSFMLIPEILSALSIEFSDTTAAMSVLIILIIIGVSFVFFARATFHYLHKGDLIDSEAGEDMLDEKVLAYAEHTQLSAREKEVLALIYRGFTFNKIAEVLFISPNTVTTHAKSIYKKLHVHSKQELIDHINESFAS